ncbi:hypothetical protein EDD95_8155 [Streptomyces sp. CEV 2-1]|nr:hypothetical protein EDD95_8155 [Streptomyces sp. CEV 2-1]
MSDDLHTRYMAAIRAYGEHLASCDTCTSSTWCKVGGQLFERFARLQDAYLQRPRH